MQPSKHDQETSLVVKSGHVIAGFKYVPLFWREGPDRSDHNLYTG